MPRRLSTIFTHAQPASWLVQILRLAIAFLACEAAIEQRLFDPLALAGVVCSQCGRAYTTTRKRGSLFKIIALPDLSLFCHHANSHPRRAIGAVFYLRHVMH